MGEQEQIKQALVESLKNQKVKETKEKEINAAHEATPSISDKQRSSIKKIEKKEVQKIVQEEQKKKNPTKTNGHKQDVKSETKIELVNETNQNLKTKVKGASHSIYAVPAANKNVEPTIPPSQWSTERVIEWLTCIGLGRHMDAFQESSIDGLMLLDSSIWTEETMKETLNIQNIFHRKKLIREIKKLSELQQEQEKIKALNNAANETVNYTKFMQEMTTIRKTAPVLTKTRSDRSVNSQANESILQKKTSTRDLLKQFFADRAKATRKKQNVLKRTASANVMLSPIVEIRKKRKSLKPIASAMDIYSSNSRTNTDTMLVSNIGSIQESKVLNAQELLGSSMIPMEEKEQSKISISIENPSSSDASDTDDDEEVTIFDHFSESAYLNENATNASKPSVPLLLKKEMKEIKNTNESMTKEKKKLNQNPSALNKELKNEKIEQVKSTKSIQTFKKEVETSKKLQKEKEIKEFEKDNNLRKEQEQEQVKQALVESLKNQKVKETKEKEMNAAHEATPSISDKQRSSIKKIEKKEVQKIVQEEQKKKNPTKTNGHKQDVKSETKIELVNETNQNLKTKVKGASHSIYAVPAANKNVEPTIPPSQWSTERVIEWLTCIGLGRHMDAFQESSIDGLMLLDSSIWTEETMIETLNIQNIFHRKKLIREIKKLSELQQEQEKIIALNNAANETVNYTKFMQEMTTIRKTAPALTKTRSDRSVISQANESILQKKTSTRGLLKQFFADRAKATRKKQT